MPCLVVVLLQKTPSFQEQESPEIAWKDNVNTEIVSIKSHNSCKNADSLKKNNWLSTMVANPSYLTTLTRGNF